MGSQRVNHARLFIFIIKNTSHVHGSAIVDPRFTLTRFPRSCVKVTDRVLANRYLNLSRLSSLLRSLERGERTTAQQTAAHGEFRNTWPGDRSLCLSLWPLRRIAKPSGLSSSSSCSTAIANKAPLQRQEIARSSSRSVPRRIEKAWRLRGFEKANAAAEKKDFPPFFFFPFFLLLLLVLLRGNPR